MTKPIIQAENLGKKYMIRHESSSNGRYRRLSEELAKTIKRPFSKSSHNGKLPKREEFWALKDVSFDVAEGEVLGVIGRNGAGKSTLLKVLSRITEPSEGRVTLRGRVASLLEVGTGFHPELTGRENIFLNGAILGMTRTEVKRKFDEIVAFAEVEKFLDTPVKRYSSGMYVRLAFAVAAHLDPEILLVDEVLAVGDAEFQKKCLGKMGEVAQGGRTVLFVSHNMAAVENLCRSCLLLCNGTRAMANNCRDVIQHYLSVDASAANDVDLAAHTGRAGKYANVMRHLLIINCSQPQLASFHVGDDLEFDLTLRHERPISYLRVAIRIFNAMGQRLMTCHSDYQQSSVLRVDGPVRVSCIIRDCRLAPGRYFLELEVDDGSEILDKIDNGLAFDIASTDIYGTGRTMPSHAAQFLPDVEWKLAPIGTEADNEAFVLRPMNAGQSTSSGSCGSQ